MNDADRWIYFDGPEPEQVRPLLDALRAAPPSSAGDEAGWNRRFFEGLAPESSPGGQAEGPPGAGESAGARVTARREGEGESEGTVRSPPLVACPHVPEACAPRAPRVAVDDRRPAPAPPAPPARAPLALVSTREMGELSPEARAKLNPAFPSGPEPPRRPGVARTLKVPVMRFNLEETSPLGDDSIARAVLPFLGNTLGTGSAPFPRLTLEQYASFCAELALWPAWSAPIRLKYHVLHEAAHRAMDEHWRKKMAEEPETRAAFVGALAVYTAWLRAVAR